MPNYQLPPDHAGVSVSGLEFKGREGIIEVAEGVPSAIHVELARMGCKLVDEVAQDLSDARDLVREEKQKLAEKLRQAGEAVDRRASLASLRDRFHSLFGQTAEQPATPPPANDPDQPGAPAAHSAPPTPQNDDTVQPPPAA